MGTLKEIWAWTQQHPGTLAAISVGLISLLNAATRHWSNHEGLKRWAIFVTEILSILTSRDVAAKGPFKLPFSSVPPPESVRWPSGEKPSNTP